MITTHLVFLDFFHGATASTAVTPTPTPEPQPTGGRGGVANWPGRTEYGWEKWRRKEDAKLKRLQEQKAKAEKKVVQLRKKVDSLKDQIELARAIEKLKALLADLEKAQELLEKQQAIVDDYEMQEVARVWAVWNQLH